MREIPKAYASYRGRASGTVIIGKERAFTEQEAAEVIRRAEAYEEQYKEGYEAGLRAYAWWKDGVQYVGSCGTTLDQALKEQP